MNENIKNTNPLVSILILNWNGEQHIHKCLDYLFKQSYGNTEIIIIDNNSNDGSIEKIISKFQNLVIIRNKENFGYAFGMNQGICAASGEFIIPLNQDVCLHGDFIFECVKRIQADMSIGAIGGRVYAWVGDELTDNLRKGEGERTYLKKCFKGAGGIRIDDNEAFVFSPSGSLPFFRKTMLEDLKLSTGDYYDENFVTGWEDVDMFFRMHLRGWTCLFLPKAKGWHVGSGSVGGNATLISKKIDYQIRVLRNRYFTIIKNLPFDIIVWLFPYLFITEVCLIPYFAVRSPKTIVALIAAWYQTLVKLPILLKKRNFIQKNIIAHKGYLKQYFNSF
jgi:GT2 family glycosyltransferase